MTVDQSRLFEWVLQKPGLLRLQKLNTVPRKIQQGWVRLAPTRVGICGSDIHIYTGDRKVSTNLRLGHEVTAIVVDGNQTGWKPGARVVVEPNIPCGTCVVCHQSVSSACPNKTILGITIPGGLASLMDAPSDYLYAIPDDLSEDAAVLVEPFAVAVHAVRTMGSLIPGDSVAIVGAGAQGVLLARLLQHQNRVVLFENNVLRTQALQEMDSTLEVQQASDEVFRYVFETGGTAGSAELAVNLLMPGGTLVIVGLSQEPLPVTPFRIARAALTIRGSIIYDHGIDFRASLEGITQRRAAVLMPTKNFAFEDAPLAFESLLRGETMKAIINIEGDVK